MSSNVIRFKISDELAQRADAVIEQMQRAVPAADITRNSLGHYAFKVIIEQEESQLNTYAVWFKVSNNDDREHTAVQDVTGLYTATRMDNPDLDDEDIINKVLDSTDASAIVKATNKYEAIMKAAEQRGEL
jgi:hypothetical protein